MEFNKHNVRCMWDDDLLGKQVYVGDYIKDLMVQVCTEAETTTVTPSYRSTEYPFSTEHEIFRFAYIVGDKDDDAQWEFDFD